MPAFSTATLSDPSLPNPSFVADEAGIYTAALVVNDGTEDSLPSTVNIAG